MKAPLIRYWDAKARAGFTYLADPVGNDNWREHADEALSGRPWQGDCDDLASTAVELLSRAGVPLADLYRLEVDSSHCGSADHLIACTRDDTGTWWIVGDTFDPAYLARDCPHRPVQYQCMADIMAPLTGAPWA